MLLQMFAWGLVCRLPVRRVRNTTESGQGLVEYAALIVLVAVIVLLVLYVFGQTIKDNLYQNILNVL